MRRQEQPTSYFVLRTSYFGGAMRILVCVKQVPDPNTVVYQIDPGSKRLVRDGVANVLDPGAEVALEAALQLSEKAGDSTVTVVSMGPEDAEDAIRRALAMGAD